MWYCPECGTKIENDGRFCFQCGQARPEIVAEDTGMTAVANEEITKKRSKAKFIGVGIGAAIIVLIFFGAAFAKDYMITKDPVKRIAYGYMQLLEADRLETNSKLSINVSEYPAEPEVKMVVDLLKKAELEINVKGDNLEKRFLQEIYLNFDGDQLADANIYVDKEVVAANLPLLIDDWIYLELDKYEEMIEEMSDGEVSQFTAEDYSPLLRLDDVENWKEIRTDYAEFLIGTLNEYVEEGTEEIGVTYADGDKTKTIMCEEVIVKMDIRDMLDLAEELVEKIEDDDRMKEIFVYKVNQFIEIAKQNGDIDSMDIDEDDIDDMLDEAEDGFNDMLDDMLYSISEARKELSYSEEVLNSKIIWNFRFDKNHVLRNILTTIQMDYQGYYPEESFEAEIINNYVVKSINDKVGFEKPNFSGGYNFAEDPQEVVLELEEEIQQNFMRNIMGNEKLGRIFQPFYY